MCEVGGGGGVGVRLSRYFLKTRFTPAPGNKRKKALKSHDLRLVSLMIK